MTTTATEPFTLDVPDEALEDLHRRLEHIRWPSEIPNSGWDYGTNLGYLQELCAYWRDEYDWRPHEAWLNSFNHIKIGIDGYGVHAVHEQGVGPAPMPLVMTHGWCGTVWEMLPSIRALADPAAHGGDAADAFHVVAPSIPGFGFSDIPTEAGYDIIRTAAMWNQLMSALGYASYGAYGSDWGAGVTRQIGSRFADHVYGIITPGAPLEDREPETPEEEAYFERRATWQVAEAVYQRIQGTKPQTLAYGLTDSAAGLAGWITEKLRTWSDCDGEVERRFTKDQILTLISIYWHTGTIHSSTRYYLENGLGNPDQRSRRAFQVTLGDIPIGVAAFPGITGTGRPPRSLVDPSVKITFWSDHGSGGHFPAVEEPELLVQDLRNFFRPFR